MKIYPEKSNYNQDDSTLADCNAQLCTPKGVVHKFVGQKLLKPYILKVFWLTNCELFHSTFD
jgi:hypothetical protein